MEAPTATSEFLRSHDRFLISTHVNPDGDGLGSAMGLCWLLKKMGKKVAIRLDDTPPDTFDYFDNYSEWVIKNGSKTPFDDKEGVGAAIVADAPGLNRLGSVANLVDSKTPLLVIDHHPTDQQPGKSDFVDSSFSSTSEMIYNLIIALGYKPDKACSTYLYTGLLIDTGRFRFSNTSPSALTVGANLVACGAEPHTIAERLFYHNSWETTKALGRIIDSIELNHDGKSATCQFDLEFVMSDEWNKIDTEGFVNHALAIEGVEVAAMLREVRPNVTRASIRAKHDVDVNEIAKTFGGGGHAKAAGCTIEFPLEEAKAKLLAVIEARWLAGKNG